MVTFKGEILLKWRFMEAEPQNHCQFMSKIDMTIFLTIFSLFCDHI